MKCPNCGAELPDNAAFCFICGSKIVRNPRPISFCRECGSKLPEGAQFCLNCGAPVAVIGANGAAQPPMNQTDDQTENKPPIINVSIQDQQDPSAVSSSTQDSQQKLPTGNQDGTTELDQAEEQATTEVPGALIVAPNNATMGSKIKTKCLDVWQHQDLLCKICIISVGVSILLLLIGSIAGNWFSILFSILQILLSVIIILAHKGIIKDELRKQKKTYFLILILLLVLNLISYSWNSSRNSNDAPVENVQTNDVAIPGSASHYKYKNYADVEKELKEAGFTNISHSIVYDVIVGLFTSEGEVESVVIDGQEDFSEGDIFAKDAEIIITYHMGYADDPERQIEATPTPAPTEEVSEQPEVSPTQTELPAEPATDASPAQNSEPVTEPNEAVSAEYKNALKTAQQYASFMHMSKQGIYDQLTSEYGENFPADAAQYALDNLEWDWNANALATAQSYSDTMQMSKRGIYEQLISESGEQFKEDEAQYAVDHVNANWNENALATAKSYQETMNMSKSAIYEQLVSEYGEAFTAEEAQYAIDNLN